MQITETDKINILINLLIEKNGAAHRMRERSFNFVVWILGFAFAVIGYFLVSKLGLTVEQKNYMSLLVLIALVLSIHFVGAIHRGFNQNYKLMVRIEKALKLFEDGVYDEGISIYSNEYKRIGKKEKGIIAKAKTLCRSHFPALYLWLVLTALLLCIVFWVCPTCINKAGDTSGEKVVSVELNKKGG